MDGMDTRQARQPGGQLDSVRQWDSDFGCVVKDQFIEHGRLSCGLREGSSFVFGAGAATAVPGQCLFFAL